jgi:Reverse transcriptase (RNA-dependent DNA polymerase)
LSEKQVPATVKEAIGSNLSKGWYNAMSVEYDSLKNPQTWEKVPRNTAYNIVKGKWVYALKKNDAGLVTRFKARYNAKGFAQVKGIDYDVILKPTLSRISLGLLIFLAANYKLRLRQLGVQTAVLYGVLDKEVYMGQPPMFEEAKKLKDQYVCKLKKSIYGLRQSSSIWNQTITQY